ncbi:MAG: MotE family protein [Chitinispirillaceae bacterium]
MNLRMKDIIAIVVVTCVSFPVLYLIMLFITGTLRVEYGAGDPSREKKEVELVKQSARRDSLAVQNSRTFLALQKERRELRKERERLMELQERLGIVQNELEQQRTELNEDKKELDKMLESSSEAQEARYKQLAKVYEAMKAVEAAAILETLPDSQVAKILTTIIDDRQKANILAEMSKEKAKRLSQLITRGI